MYALIENNAVTKVGELATLFPNTSNPNHAFADSHGAKEVVEGTKKDERFYWVTFDKYTIKGNVVERTYVNTPKALEDITVTPEGSTEPVTTKGLKSTWIAQIKATANSMLAKTDWAVVRKMERNIDIPANILAERAAIIAECNKLEQNITAAQGMEVFMNIVTNIDWNVKS